MSQSGQSSLIQLGYVRSNPASDMPRSVDKCCHNRDTSSIPVSVLPGLPSVASLS